MRLARLLVASVIVSWQAGCFDPTFPEGAVCSGSQSCPGDQLCVRGKCSDRATDPPGDATSGLIGDTCANPRPAMVGLKISGSLAGAVDDFDPPGDCGTDGIEVVYVFDLGQSDVISLRVSSSTFTGQFYKFTSCPPPDFRACGNIAQPGGTVGTDYPAGKVFLVIERETGIGTEFDINFE